LNKIQQTLDEVKLASEDLDKIQKTLRRSFGTDDYKGDVVSVEFSGRNKAYLRESTRSGIPIPELRKMALWILEMTEDKDERKQILKSLRHNLTYRLQVLCKEVFKPCLAVEKGSEGGEVVYSIDKKYATPENFMVGMLDYVEMMFNSTDDLRIVMNQGEDEKGDSGESE